MFRSKSHGNNRFQNPIQSCKRLFHKLGVAVALSTISGCPSVPTTVNYVELRPLTKQEEVIFNQTDLFKDCYCVEKQRRRNPKDSDTGCLEIYTYILSTSPVRFSARAINGEEPLPEYKIELDQSIVDIVDFCVSAILRSKETTPIKDVVSRTQPDKK